MKIVLIFLLVTNIAFGQDFIPIKKGEPSPIDGFAISPTTEKMVRQKVENLEYKLIKLSDLGVAKDELISAQKRHIAAQKEYNGELRDELLKSDGFWTKAMWFTLGTVITGVISYGTVRSLRN